MSQSDETRIALLENNQINILEKLDESIKDNKEQHQAIMQEIKDMRQEVKSALKMKANVWVEKVLIWLGRTIGLGVITYLGYLIIKLIEIKTK